MKLGIIRCMQTEDYCPGTTDFRLLAAHEGAFQNIPEPIEDQAALRARLLVERGADAIAFASCIGKGTPIGYPCPFFRKMLELVKQELPEGAKVFELKERGE